jgi:hypothetical protein
LSLAESLRVAHQAGALRTPDLKRVTVDTTVQPKAITFPTDAKLAHAAIRGLNRVARAHGLMGAIALRKRRSRNQLEQSLANVPPCLIGMEACAGAHHLGRMLANGRDYDANVLGQSA